ncbi:ABC-type transport auxiliary lipoprotein family protein [Desulfovibrio sp. OttesenSCG-928-I05]|nr:ABC-type transport auxiliary lipoprotein family protein [Desulfovibrio sp. OttesenSCG-928-I05]
MKYRFRFLFALVFCLTAPAFLGGCALLETPPPPLAQVLLVPTPPAAAPEAGARMPLQLTVVEPAADSVASSDRISAVFNGFEVRYLADARWSAPVPKLLQRLFIESLEAGGRFAGVGDGGSGMRSDIRLNTDIKRFGLRYRDARTPVVEASLTFRLLDVKTGRILGTLGIAEEEAAGEDSVAHYVLAFNTMMGRVLSQLSVWTAATVNETL